MEWSGRSRGRREGKGREARHARRGGGEEERGGDKRPSPGPNGQPVVLFSSPPFSPALPPPNRNHPRCIMPRAPRPCTHGKPDQARHLYLLRASSDCTVGTLEDPFPIGFKYFSLTRFGGIGHMKKWRIFPSPVISYEFHRKLNVGRPFHFPMFLCAKQYVVEMHLIM